MIVCLRALLWALAAVLPVSGTIHASSTGVVISQVYGGGGNSGAVLRNDFIELFNASQVPVAMNGWSVQYASAGGASWQVTNLPSVTLQPGQYYLIQQAQGTGGTQSLPAPDVVGGIPMGAGSGKVALVRSQVALAVSNPSGGNIEDLVGYAASFFEGSAAAPGPANNTVSALRAAGGCVDTNNNGADFATGPANPRNSSIVAPCPATQPVLGSCPSFSTVQGLAGSSGVLATDLDSLVNAASITAGAIPGITLNNFVPAPAIGGFATASIQVAASVVQGTYPVTVTFSNADPEPQSFDCSLTVTVLAAPGAVTPIYSIQGSGSTSPFVGQTVTTRGVVTAVLPGLRGYFIQDETGDGNVLTSDGIFVFNNTQALAVSVGERIQVTATVAEYNAFVAGNPSVTQLTNPSQLVKLGTGTIAPVAVGLPEAVDGDLERYEGMLVQITSPMVVAQNFFLGRYGQLTLSAGTRPIKPTNQFRPGTPQAIAAASANARARLVLDDGSSSETLFSGVENPNPIPYIGLQNTVRAGDVVTNLVGVIDFGRITSAEGTSAIVDYRIHPVVAPTITRANPRPMLPPSTGGTTRVASFNVLNFFTTFGNGQTASGQSGQGCLPSNTTSDCRGAGTLAEFNRQRTKIVEAIFALDADVVGLMEIQRNGAVAMQNLVDALNVRAGANRYAIVPEPASGVGTDAIKVGFIYQPARLSLSGAGLSDTNPIHDRPPVAQAFVLPNGAKFSVIVNHFKSKRCDGAAGLDLDQGDGQGCFNDRRRQQATRLLQFISTVQQAAGDNDVLVIGDLNAYGKEDPVDILTAAGLQDLIANFGGTTAYSYVFDGEAGYLDHALATPSLAAQVVGAGLWTINADEPSVIDYNTEFKPQDLYTPEVFRSSDHDPVLVGMNLTGPAQAQTITFVAPADRALDSGPFVVSASATSLLPVVFGSTTPLVCSVSGGTVALLAVGACTITADQPGSAAFLPAPQQARTFAVLASSQSISFAALPERALDQSPFLVAATASSGLPVVFTSGSPTVCSVSGNSVALLATGTCVLLADQPGNAGFAAAPQVSRAFAVTAANGAVPLPLWAYLLLGGGLLHAALRRQSRLRDDGRQAALPSPGTSSTRSFQPRFLSTHGSHR
ncbi:MAG: ExeM/NucH family extracellular endonuclease [Betaproteobacteria bacterium]|nr:ExeM/NucH family extracellular endonuclease [Betaproteobacteria bacterium]